MPKNRKYRILKIASGLIFKNSISSLLGHKWKIWQISIFWSLEYDYQVTSFKNCERSSNSKLISGKLRLNFGSTMLLFVFLRFYVWLRTLDWLRLGTIFFIRRKVLVADISLYQKQYKNWKSPFGPLLLNSLTCN